MFSIGEADRRLQAALDNSLALNSITNQETRVPARRQSMRKVKEGFAVTI
jgi:hypothetical protein